MWNLAGPNKIFFLQFFLGRLFAWGFFGPLGLRCGFTFAIHVFLR